MKIVVRGRVQLVRNKNKNDTLLPLIFICILFFNSWIGIYEICNQVEAEPVIIDDGLSGSWTDSFYDEQGIENKLNITVCDGGAMLNSVVNGTNWTKEGLALDVGSPGDPDDLYAHTASVIWDRDGLYKMWYKGHDGTTGRILYATSFDSFSWVKLGVVLDLGPPGSYDDVTLENPKVLKESENYYRLWYRGNDGSAGRILYANSSDGVTWNKVGLSLNIGNTGELDDEIVRPSTIYKTNDGTYKMWYDGFDGSNFRIFYAISSDGISWNKQGVVLQPGSPGELDDTHVAGGHILLDSDGNYKMWYSGHDGSTYYRIFFATSPDGETWTKQGLVLDAGNPGDYDEDSVSNPWVIRDGDWYKMWYTGASSGRSRTLLATSPAIYNTTNGYLISTKISVPFSLRWTELLINKTEPGTDNFINVSILDGETNEIIPGFENLTSNSINLTSLDYIAHPTIRLLARFVTNGSTTPILHTWSVSWGDITPPTTPSGFKVNNPYTGYSLISSWDPNSESDFACYVLYYSIDNSTFYWLTNISANTISFIHYGLTQGTTYYYKIAAADDVPNQSPFSEVIEGLPDLDYDGDGIGNTIDPDDDNDGIPDISDPYPLNPLNDIEATIDSINLTVNDIQDNVIDIQLDIDSMNTTIADLELDIGYLNQTIPKKIDDLTLQLAGLNESIFSRITDTEVNILDHLQGLNISLADDIQNLLNNMTIDYDSLRNWLEQAIEAVDINLTETNTTLHQQLNNLESSIATFYSSLSDDIDDILTELQMHDQTTGENHSEIIAMLEDLRTLKHNDLKTKLVNLAENISKHNQSIADDIWDVINDMDTFEAETNRQLQDINRTLADLAKLEIIVNDLEALDQALDIMEDELQDSLDDISTKDEDGKRFMMIQLLLIIVIILLLVNMIITISSSLRKKHQDQHNTNQKRLEQEEEIVATSNKELPNEQLKNIRDPTDVKEIKQPPPPSSLPED